MKCTPDNPELRLRAMDGHQIRVDFLARLKHIDHCQDDFLQGMPQELQAIRDELKAGRDLLQDPDDIALCDELLSAFRSRLAKDAILLCELMADLSRGERN